MKKSRSVWVTRFLVDTVLGRPTLDKFWSDRDWASLLKTASHNRVLYVLAKELLKEEERFNTRQQDDLRQIVSEGKLWLGKFQRTVKFLEQAFRGSGVPWLVVKTFKFFDYVTFDVDVLVPYESFRNAQELLAGSGCRILPHSDERGLHQRNCQKDGLLNIDLHRKFFWQGVDPIDLDFVWRSPETKMVNGAECLCPPLEADFLLHARQIVCERYYITLLDFLALKFAYERGPFNSSAVNEQVAKYGWQRSYRSLLSYLDRINAAFFGVGLWGESSSRRRRLRLPYPLSYLEVGRQIGEMVSHHRVVPWFNLAYYHFAFGRYLLSGRERLPYYQHWFDFSLLGE